MKKFLLLATVVVAACSPAPPPEPLADPRFVYAEAFSTPIQEVKLEAVGGHESDAWVVFSSDERLELKEGERFSILAPSAAVEFFTTAAPEQAARLPQSGAVCLSYRDLEGDLDDGAYLLFEPGSGLYFYRTWSRSAEQAAG